MLEPKDIVVFLDSTGDEHRVTFAATQAARWGAYLIGVFVPPVRRPSVADAYARGHEAIGDVIAQEREFARVLEDKAHALFEKALVQHAVGGEWRLAQHGDGERLMLHARHAGLAIVAPPPRYAVNEAADAFNVSAEIVLASGRPCLLLPPSWPPGRLGRRIVVGWNGSREATRALADAMCLLVRAESVLAVVVDEPKTRGLLHGQEPGADICRHLVRYGVAVTLEQVPEAPAGETLLRKTKEFGADLLVMGAYGHSKITEVIFGGATRTILQRADIPVLLSR
jgi:nucleotide-binding universal stress UspA family protein